MNAKVDRNELYRTLREVSKCAHKGIDGLMDVKISSNPNGTLNLACTNLEIGVQKQVKAEISDEFVFCTDAREFTKIIRAIKSDVITLSLDRNYLSILFDPDTCIQISVRNDEKFYFSGFDALTPLAEFHPAKELIECTRRVRSFTSQDDACPVLQCVYVDNDAVAATDGFRIAWLPCDIVGFKGLIPARVLAYLDQLQIGLDSSFTVIGSRMYLKSDDTLVVFELGDGNFPEFRVIFPKSSNLSVTVQTWPLLSFLRTFQQIEKIVGGQNSIVFEIYEDRVELESKLELERIETKISAKTQILDAEKFNSFPFKIAFNVNFLVEALQKISTEEVELLLNSSNSPLELRCIDPSDRMRFLIMPIHLG